jgi:hypothetical protein
LLIYDDLDATGSAGFFGAGCCSLGHQFSWSTGVKTGRARLVLGETSNAGTARAYYSLDSGTSWTQFGSTTVATPTAILSATLATVNLATFRVKITCTTSYPDSGTCTAYELDFVADPPPCP